MTQPEALLAPEYTAFANTHDSSLFGVLRRLGGAFLTLASWLTVACQTPAANYPWSSDVPAHAAEHAEVRTMNAGYDRLHSHVLVREIGRPTRANLD